MGDGNRTSGVAVGWTLWQTANRLPVLRSPQLQREEAHYHAWVGQWSVPDIDRDLPKLRDGKEHPLAAPIRRIGAKCQEAFGLPVHYIDEYLSSHEARARLPGEKEVDAMAAAIIAED